MILNSRLGDRIMKPQKNAISSDKMVALPESETADCAGFMFFVIHLPSTDQQLPATSWFWPPAPIWTPKSYGQGL